MLNNSIENSPIKKTISFSPSKVNFSVDYKQNTTLGVPFSLDSKSFRAVTMIEKTKEEKKKQLKTNVVKAYKYYSRLVEKELGLESSPSYKPTFSSNKPKNSNLKEKRKKLMASFSSKGASSLLNRSKIKRKNMNDAKQPSRFINNVSKDFEKSETNHIRSQMRSKFKTEIVRKPIKKLRKSIKSEQSENSSLFTESMPSLTLPEHNNSEEVQRSEPTEPKELIKSVAFIGTGELNDDDGTKIGLAKNQLKSNFNESYLLSPSNNYENDNYYEYAKKMKQYNQSMDFDSFGEASKTIFKHSNFNDQNWSRGSKSYGRYNEGCLRSEKYLTPSALNQSKDIENAYKNSRFTQYMTNNTRTNYYDNSYVVNTKSFKTERASYHNKKTTSGHVRSQSGFSPTNSYSQTENRIHYEKVYEQTALRMKNPTRLIEKDLKEERINLKNIFCENLLTRGTKEKEIRMQNSKFYKMY